MLERDQGYDDLASLLDLSEAEVRARARAALTDLGGADPDRNVGLTDYLLGQADPIGRADAVRHLRDDREDFALATRLAETLREMYPGAELPRLPGEPRPPRRGLRERIGAPRRTPAARHGEGGPLGALSDRQARTLAIGGGASILLIVIVLAITGVFGGGDDGADSPATTTAPADEQIQRVPLNPVGGGDATGEALFGLATGDQPYVDISIRGLDPAPQDKSYVIWLMLTGDQGYPLSPIAVNQDGSFENRYPIPSAVLPVVARVRFVDVAIAPVGTIRKTVRSAIKNTQLVLEKPGDTVLRGEIPKAQSSSQQSGS